MTDFQGKVVWVTGASSGLGAAMAKALDARGASVIASGRRRDALDAVAGELTRPALVLPFNITDYPAMEAAAATALDWRGGVDVLINNAGISQRSLALDTDFAVYRELMEVDYFAPVRLTQLVLPSMAARGSGHIAIVSSVAGRVGAPIRTGYCGAKFAACGYFEALRAEVERAYGVDVTVILPGSVKTGIAQNSLTASGAARGRSDVNIENAMSAEAAAAQIVDGLARRDREVVIAEGLELAALEMRRADPNGLFDLLSDMGRDLAQQREAGGIDAAEPPDLTQNAQPGRPTA